MFWLKKLCKNCNEKKYIDKDGYCKECIIQINSEDDSLVRNIVGVTIINESLSNNEKPEPIDNSDLFKGGSSGGGGAEGSFEDVKSSCDCDDSCCGSSDSCGGGSDD